MASQTVNLEKLAEAQEAADAAMEAATLAVEKEGCGGLGGRAGY